jgi:hypothetical protein
MTTTGHILELVKDAEVKKATHRRKEISLPTYAVVLDDQVIGWVYRAMLTRERRTKGRRYVDARWTSPGWMYRPGQARYGRAWEASSRKDGIERLLREAVPGMFWSEAETLAATVEKIR